MTDFVTLHEVNSSLFEVKVLSKYSMYVEEGPDFKIITFFSFQFARRDKFGDSSPDSPTTADAAVALSLPDPATLASGNGTENSSSSVTDPDSTCGCSHSIGISQMPASQHQQQRPCGCSNIQNHRHHNHHYVSRLKTGSRLCHHSIATASPQKNIHRAHQTSGSSSGGFGGTLKLYFLCI